MTRNLDPTLLAFDQQLARGMLVTLPQTAEDPKAEPSVRALRFQYNPETVTRTRAGQWESKPGKTPEQTKVLTDGQRGGGLHAKSETLALKLIFDVTEALLRDREWAGTSGVLPELALLEGMALGKDQTGEEEKKPATKLVSLTPTELLLLLGPRTFPVVITGMTIVEQRFDTGLFPLRAEVDLRMRILEVGENAANSKVAQAFNNLRDQRREMEDLAAVKGADAQTLIAQALEPGLKSNGTV
ncbi:hypothetical protein D7Y13_29325 [Corallococcus praedator]|uniref:Uncharacterized protein n=1 Tax=Corallococcus praedator TaxID=2316724 RepID=A0ABX9QB66_9BACT|nr:MULTISPECIES: hypothetical protein [Corallococcus]RKH07820.1 hypothetical protein D7X74_32615 [Corallococcus sp. CA047B]RKH23286.1 hypothetical protein D7X75_34000 [Corallococcus sp. CA031C]RKH97908.1 hypothetical protein D7Y13_29325 [Corallococcus praedator]